MEDVERIIAELQTLELSTATKAELISIISRIDKILLMGMEIPRGAYVMRVRAYPHPVFPIDWKSERDIGYLRNPEGGCPLQQGQL